MLSASNKAHNLTLDFVNSLKSELTFYFFEIYFFDRKQLDIIQPHAVRKPSKIDYSNFLETWTSVLASSVAKKTEEFSNTFRWSIASPGRPEFLKTVNNLT